MAGGVYFGGPGYAPPDVANKRPGQRIENAWQQEEGQHGLAMQGLKESMNRSQNNMAVGNLAAKAGLGVQAYEGEHAAAQGAGFDTAAREQAGGIASKAREQESGLQAAAEQRRMGMFQPYMNQFLSGTTGSQSPNIPQAVDFGGLSGAEDAAQRDIFARAKDQAGNIGRSAQNSLANVMGARGLTGSGLAANAAGGVINQQATQLGEVNREQAIQAANMARQRASEQYQGGITQRGQNIAAADSQRNAMLGLLQGFQGNITARY